MEQVPRKVLQRDSRVQTISLLGVTVSTQGLCVGCGREGEERVESMPLLLTAHLPGLVSHMTDCAYQ